MKKICCVLLLAGSLFLGEVQSFASSQRLAPADSTGRTLLADRLIAEAMQYLGTPYRYGSPGPKSFDCSGFSSFIFRQFGYSLSHSSKGQARQGTEVGMPLTALRKGDIVVFASRRNKKEVGHVGIYIDGNAAGTNFRFIHADRSGVRISELKETYYSDRFLGARRILPESESVSRPDAVLLDPLPVRVDSVSALRAEVIPVPAPGGQADPVGEETYIVKKGDTLAKIAKAHGTSVDRICRLNGMTRRTLLHVGDSLRVR